MSYRALHALPDVRLQILDARLATTLCLVHVRSSHCVRHSGRMYKLNLTSIAGEVLYP